MAELNDKFEFKQDGKTYNLYDLPDGFVIKGNVCLREKGLTELPDLSKVSIEGSFWCNDNQLTSLKGAPQKVGGDFDCNSNLLTTLQGAPQDVSGNFYCSDNQLISLQGAPQEVSGGFYCRLNQLTSLLWAPQKVGEDFSCSGNQLTSLQGAPREVGKGFYCNFNNLTTLHGAPQKIGGEFRCRNNDDLSSLVGLPKMPEDEKIYCDKTLAEKYNCPKLKHNGIYYHDLIESVKYQSELSALKIRQKKHEENKVAQDKFKAGYAAFKKKQAEERE